MEIPWPKVAVACVLAAMVYKNCDFLGGISRVHEFDPFSKEFRLRPVAEHWNYIYNKADFVTVYSTNASRGSGHNLFEGDYGYRAEEVDIERSFLNSHSDGVTRCATTQYALTNYFCGDDVAGEDTEFVSDLSELKEVIQLWYSDDLDSIQSLKSKKNVPNKESVNKSGTLRHLILRGHISQEEDSVGHTYIMQLTPNATVVIYQSYIAQYTLHGWMSKLIGKNREGSYEVSSDDFLEQLNKIELLERAKVWDHRVDAAYGALYDVHLMKADVNKWLDTMDLGGRSGVRGMHQKKMEFSWSFACQLS